MNYLCRKLFAMGLIPETLAYALSTDKAAEL